MSPAGKHVCVVGAGLSGLAAVRGLTLGGHQVKCFEAGSSIGGMWRYDNDNGLSAAYASLTANVSRERMRYPSFAARDSMGEFPHHSDLLSYLEQYAAANDLLPHVTCGAFVERARAVNRGWEVTVRGAQRERFDALVVAAGHYWDPVIPEIPGDFDGAIVHGRDYRTPDRFAGQRVVVVGAAQSALDIATEVSSTAAHAILSCRQGHHLIPRHIFGRPFDELDSARGALVPLPIVRLGLGVLMRAARATPDPGDLPPPRHPLFESRWPVVVTDAAQRALTERAFECRPGISRFERDRVIFADGSAAQADAVIFGTGYQTNFPFLPERLGRGQGWQFPLYRRILSPHADALGFIGILEPGPGLFEIVERQVEWLSEAFAGRVPVPDRELMWRAIDAGGERRSRRQFADTGPHTLLCNRHAYMRVLGRDLRRARRDSLALVRRRSETRPALRGPPSVPCPRTPLRK